MNQISNCHYKPPQIHKFHSERRFVLVGTPLLRHYKLTSGRYSLRKDYEKRIKADREKEVIFQENMLIKNEDFKLGIYPESKPYLSIDPDEIIYNAEDFEADQDIDDELPF